MAGDVVDLRDFYETPLGRTARRMIGRRVHELWPDLAGQRVLGLGFATPYLRPYIAAAERVMAMMPASQGVLAWPPEGPGRVALAEELALPLPDRAIDRLLLIHCLETTDNERALMREAWRVLADGGRLLVVAPNRRSLWARLDSTPFGTGRPYTTNQLGRLLRDTMFMPVQTRSALVMPPFAWRVMMRAAPAWEKLGRNWLPNFAGVHLVEATKQLYAATGGVRARAQRERAYVPVPEGFRLAGSR